MENYEEDSLFENFKSEIIERFLKRDKVRLYFKKLLVDNLIKDDWINEIKGISYEVAEDIKDLFNLFEINEIYLSESLKIDHTTWWYDLDPLLPNDLDFYLPIFFYEFALYPVSFIKKLKLEKVYFVNSLNFATDSYSQYRAAVPDYCCDTMAMVYCCKERNFEYMKSTIHHELFHFFDYIEDGVIFGPDPCWECLNGQDFKYGDGGAMNRVWKPLDCSVRGFLNFYSTTGIEEDKAEIFAHMMNKSCEIKQITCPILNDKFTFIRNMLTNFDPNGFGKGDYWEWLQFNRNGLYEELSD